jgi:uncharacterized membrane protein YgdD (TMEM256/DUF423 family)
MKNYLAVTALLGAITIIFGAFGAHALKEILSDESLKSFETAVRYQMYHVLLLLFINLNSFIDKKAKKQLSLIIMVGILLFSGSIYCITLLKVPAKSIWFTTPLGGLFLIIGWLLLAINLYKGSKN